MGESCQQELSFDSEAGIHEPPSPIFSNFVKPVPSRSYISQNFRYWTGPRIEANRLVRDQSVLIRKPLFRMSSRWRGWLGVL